MKVLFIVPPFGELSDEGGVKQKMGFLPPIGLALLATIIDNDGHEVKIFDMQVRTYGKEDVAQQLEQFRPDVVCLNIIAASTRVVRQVNAMVKAYNPSIITLAGGVHASMFPKDTLNDDPNQDYLAYGEAEYTIKELLRALEEKTSIKEVKGVYYRKNGDIEFTGFRPIEQDLDVFPVPSRKFFDMTQYIPLPSQYSRLPNANMITGRGCTYSLCTFCFESVKFVRDKGYRRISVDKAMEEVHYLVDEYGVKEIAFWDDEFLMGMEWVDEFCDRLIAEKVDISWSCYGKVNFCKPDLLKKMAKSGCWSIFMGLESGNQDLLNFTKKGQTLKMMKEAVIAAQNAGIEVRGSFILGLPKETPAIAQETIDFAKELDLDYAQFLLNTPFPGTEMAEVCKSGEYGHFDQEAGFEKYTEHSALFLPKDYSNVDELLKIQKSAYRQFYFRPKYVLRKLKGLKTAKDFRRYWDGFNFLLKVRVLKSSEI